MGATIAKTAIIYCRVSSKEQIDGTSLESQEEQCREYAERNGVEVLRVYVEMGESAKSADRTELQAALGYCSERKNKVDYFIVYKVDRFSRNTGDHVAIRALLQKYGTNLRSVTEPINESSTGQLLEGILSSFSQFDNNVRAERSKAGLIERVKQGVWCWQTPFGYCRPPHAPNIAPDEATAPHVHFAFEEYSKGVYTFRKIAELLKERGCITKSGKAPSPQMIEKMLRNPIYCGIIRAFGEDTKGTFEAIVSEALFWKCQKDPSKPTKFAGPRAANNPMFPLRKFVVCDECKTPITGSASRGRQGQRYPYYHHGHTHCPKAVSIPKETFEQLFAEYLDTITPDPRYEKLFKAIILDVWKTNYKQLNEGNATIRKTIAKLEADRQRIFDLRMSNTYTDEEFLQQKAIVNRKIEEQNRLLASQQVEEFDMETALDYCFDYVGHAARKWVEMENDYAKRIRFQKLILKKKLEFDGEKFGNSELSLIFQTKKTSPEEKSLLVTQPELEWNIIENVILEWSRVFKSIKIPVFTQ